MKIVVYTCITGGKDTLKDMPYEEGVDYVAFTDQPVQSDLWDVRPVTFYKTGRLTARKYKVLCNELFPEADYTIWIDGSMELVHKPSYYVKKYMKHNFIASRPHPGWNCIYQEAIQIQRRRYENNDILIAWIKKLLEEGYPENNGLAETGLLVRDNSDKCKKFCEEWWSYIDEYSARDQLSFNYTHWKQGTSYALIKRSEVIWTPHEVITTTKT